MIRFFFKSFVFSTFFGLLVFSLETTSVWAQRTGTTSRGPRPSMGAVGGGGTGGSISRPTNMSRPNPGAASATRPQQGNRPSMGNVPGARPMPNIPQQPTTRPGNLPSIPNMGGNRPGLGGIGSGQTPNLPSTRPTAPTTRPTAPTTRPSVPTTRPATPDRPARPNLGNQANPGAQGVPGRPTLPDFSNRPNVTLPNVKPPTNRPQNKLPEVDRPGGGRPIAGIERPTTLPGDIQRPSTRPTRPSLGAGKPETLPGITGRPNLQERPSPGRPELGNIGRPTTLPEDLTRPRPDRPITRPLPGDRPTTLPGDRPTRPLPGDRPTTLPGDRPTRPFPGDRPTTLPGDRPTRPLPGDRPTTLPQTRPNLPQRPTTLPDRVPSWGNQTRPGFNNPGNVNINRPVIGGPRTNIGNINNFNINNINISNNQININTGNQFFNRPRWDIDPGFSRPAWGLAGPSWRVRWHVNSVRFRFGWYNGCWPGHWGSAWYAPVTWIGVGWGLNSWTSGWGGQPYFNPYFAEPAMAQSLAFDYSQPVVVNNIVQVDQNGQEVEVKTTSQEEQGLNAFDEGLQFFRQGDYVRALSRFNVALQNLPGDAVVHEVRSLALFAVGDYKAAAAGLNSLLSAAPGMDWTTMSGLYGNLDDYTAQLRKLEQFVQDRPTDAAANFVLAYHYLVLDSTAEAIEALRAVVENQPRDVTAKRMLEELDPAEPTLPTPDQAELTEEIESDDFPQTDLVGKWQAQTSDSRIDLTIGEDATFYWLAVSPGQPKLELQGNIAGDVDGIKLITVDNGTLGGTVRSMGPDDWVFRISGTPPVDKGIEFTRVK